MAKRDKRETRFGVLKNFYEMFSTGLLGSTPEENLDKITKNVQFAKEQNGIMIFESEVDNFAEKYPNINIEDFKKFITETGALKTSSTKKDPSERESHTRLNTEEAATERGVATDKVAEYVSEVEQIYVLCKSLNAKMTGARASFAIPREHPKVKEDTSAPEQPPTQ